MRIGTSSSKTRGALPALDSDGLCVHESSDGYYWKAKGVRQTHGPFGSLVDALDDIQRQAGSDLIGETEDWVDEVGYEAAYPA